jgi:hypothetical protein
MTTFNLRNDADCILRIIIEPEAIEYDLKPKDQVVVIVTGENPAFECVSSIDKEGVNCITLWPDKGRVVIQFEGKNIINLV